MLNMNKSVSFGGSYLFRELALRLGGSGVGLVGKKSGSWADV
jgi:hypothetical protein